MNTMYDAPADGGYPAGAPDPHTAWFRTTRWRRWGVGAAVFGFLVGGGITLAAVSGGGGQASGAQAAGLNTALSDAAGNSAVPPARVRWALGRLRRLGGVDGTATFHNKTGFHTLSFERGTIASVSGGEVVVKAADGTTWSWHLVSDTVVRKSGSKTTTSALSAGETVFAAGPVVSGTRDARLIVIRPSGPAGSSTAPAPAGSQSAQTSLS